MSKKASVLKTSRPVDVDEVGQRNLSRRVAYEKYRKTKIRQNPTKAQSTKEKEENNRTNEQDEKGRGVSQ